MKKIIIIGCPGSGKSTFARELQRVTDISPIYLDMLNWNSDKTVVEKEVFLERLKNAMEAEQWIIDGNYKSTMEMRIEKCDTIFFLDYPLEVCLDGIEKRMGVARPDMPWIEYDTDHEFIKFIVNYRADVRPYVLSLLDKNKDKNIVIFNSRQEAAEFISALENRLSV